MSEATFLKAYETHADAIYRHCFFRIRSKEKAEDLTQETFIRAWKYIADGKEVKSTKAFLYRVANNLIIDEVRRHKETVDLQALTDAGQEPGEDTRDRLLAFLDGKDALKAVDKLDEHHRLVLVMRYIDGLKPKEIAEALDETQNVISVRINRAKKQLKTLLV